MIENNWGVFAFGFLFILAIAMPFPFALILVYIYGEDDEVPRTHATEGNEV